MCNIYTINSNLSEIADWGRASLFPDYDWDSQSPTVGVRQTGPGIWQNLDGEREIVPMQFALIPPWARTAAMKKPPFYNNARIENIDNKVWKPFMQSHRCIVPLNLFREPTYWGPVPGHMVEFHSLQDLCLGVAGIYHHFQRGDDDVISMTFLMKPAAEFVMQHGHQRQPIFLHPDGFDDWLGGGERPIEESKKVIANWNYDPELELIDLGEMKTGWEKRQPKAIEKREQEEDAIAEFGPFGCAM